MRNTITCISILLFLAVLSSTYAQGDGRTLAQAHMDAEFRISLDQRAKTALQQTYGIDISSSGFDSAARLDWFCNSFSLDFHQLRGDFASKQIIMTLDTRKLARRNWDVKKVNQ
ncbi:MAG: hypothetical protein AB3N16_08355, partial [Flavobacteriaceae bacterium]